ncbi:MAG: hypothetical protein RL419_1038 [Actinomycetota bacterium]
MSGETLFDSAAADRLRERAPLAARIRPRTLDDVVGQEHLVGVGRPLRLLVERDALTSVLFWGPPGTGKTTLAEVVALTTSRYFVRLSAVSSGVKDVREAIDGARERLGTSGQSTIVFIDEIHRFSRSQQDALLPAVENGTITLIGATTENPMFEVNSPLRSRSTLFRLEPLSRSAVTALLSRGLRALGQEAASGAIELIATRCVGDGRAALTALDVASAIAGDGHITLQAAEAALSTSAQRYGQDDHYDVVSAFIKSIRASQVDAALHWLARMLEAGEDPRFIARRLVILASEDIGLADSQSLVIAVAASHAVEHVGLPEAQLNLAHAVVYLSRAPKSNAVARAIWTAREDIRSGLVGEVPSHLRDSHYSGASQLGHGDGYISPHEDPSAAEHLTYVPEELRGQRYYREGQ